MADTDFSEISESSYADARADTPTLGEGEHTDSEVSLSSFFFFSINFMADLKINI